MTSHKIYSKQSINIIIIFSFLLSVLLSFHYISKYDKLNKLEYKEGFSHPMIKSAVKLHWTEANQIIEDIKDKKNFLEYGSDYDEFLPQRVLALYYFVIGKPILDSDGNIEINNGKFLYLILKTLLFYISIIYFANRIIKILPLKNCFYIIAFLVFEPTIFQYHSSFWNESLFFPMQILLLTYLISSSKKLSINFLIGIILGVMFTISQESFYLFIPLIFFQILKFKKDSFKISLSSLCGFLLILSIIILHNMKRTNSIFFMNDGAKSVLYLYVAPHVLSISENIEVNEAKVKINKKRLKWLEENQIKTAFNTKKFRDLGQIENKTDRLKYYNYLQYLSLRIILMNPVSTGKFIFSKNLHTLVLNPFYVKNFYKFETRGKNKYYKSETHQKEMPYRITYSIILYFIILIGFFRSFKDLNRTLLLAILLLSFYPIIVLGWMGINRYFVPSLIYLSIFFGNGMASILNFKKVKLR